MLDQLIDFSGCLPFYVSDRVGDGLLLLLLPAWCVHRPLVLGELGNRSCRRMQNLTVCQNVPVRGFEAGRDACIGGNHAGHT